MIRLEKVVHNACEVIRARCETLLVHRERCMAHDHVETVHDLRVATRRMRAALDTFRSVCLREDIKAVFCLTRSLTREFGELRNIDEALLFFSELRGSIPGDSCADLDFFLQETGRRRSEESIRVARVLEDFDTHAFLRLMRRISRHISALWGGGGKSLTCPTSLPGYLSESGIGLFGDIRQIQPATMERGAVEARHSLRISVKKYRYFLEIMSDITGCDYSEALARLKEYQSVLGTLNDLSVFSGMLENAALDERCNKLLLESIGQRSAYALDNYLKLAADKPLRHTFLL